MLAKEPRWGEGDFCEECQTKVSLPIITYFSSAINIKIENITGECH